jgi:small subunit ribosomal protein S8
MKDNISDMLTRIRNGQLSKLFEITLYSPTPSICLKILTVLYKEGYIRGIKKCYDKNKLSIKVLLKYDFQGQSTIKSIKRISKPSKRVYVNINSL